VIKRIINSSQLLTLRGEGLGIIRDGGLAIRDGRIIDVGTTEEILKKFPEGEVIDAKGSLLLPGFVDPHTHLVFAGTREDEFDLRLKGVSYKEIAERGGGILSTVKATREASEDELFEIAWKRIREIISWGTTTLEIKSGYGLSLRDELKILRVIKRLRDKSKIDIVPTFLGAHSFPEEIEKGDYIKIILEEMIPEVARNGLARFCDVFCENFVFNYEESKQILLAGRSQGLLPKIHGDEIEHSGGARLASEIRAVSCDHLLYSTEEDLIKMRDNGVIAVLLPATSLFLKSRKKPLVDFMRRIGLTIALGSDYNPGSSMIYQMPIVISLGCLIYGLTIEEAIRGATINGAKAIKMEDEIGSLESGKKADILILDAQNYKHIPYQFGRNLIRTVIKKGEVIYEKTC